MILLADAFKGVTRVGFDTAPIIYFVEAHPTYNPIVTAIFQGIDQTHYTGYTSSISLCETLTMPFKVGDLVLAERYRDLLLHSLNFITLPITAPIAESAAKLRVRYQLRTPDALSVATAIITDCDLFLTNDVHLKRITEMPVLLLDDLGL